MLEKLGLFQVPKDILEGCKRLSDLSWSAPLWQKQLLQRL
jgi:hypothetical protein